MNILILILTARTYPYQKMVIVSKVRFQGCGSSNHTTGDPTPTAMYIVCPCQVCDVDTGWIGGGGGCQHRRVLGGGYLDFPIEGNSIKNDGLSRLITVIYYIMYSMSFIPLITRPTRITCTSATCIDNICCNILLNNNTHVNGVLYTDISDHLPVFTISECTPKKTWERVSYYKHAFF